VAVVNGVVVKETWLTLFKYTAPPDPGEATPSVKESPLKVAPTAASMSIKPPFPLGLLPTQCTPACPLAHVFPLDVTVLKDSAYNPPPLFAHVVWIVLDVKENAEFTAFTYTDPPLPLAMHSEKVFPLRLSPVVARVVDRYTPPPFPVAAADVMEEEEERSNVTTFDAYTAPP